jgi:hypothetical protein
MSALLELATAFLKSPLTSTICLSEKKGFAAFYRIALVIAVVFFPVAYWTGTYWAKELIGRADAIIAKLDEVSQWKTRVEAENTVRDRRLDTMDLTHATKGHVQQVQRQVERIDDRVLFLERR